MSLTNLQVKLETMAADLFTQANMSFNPFVLSEVPRFDHGFDVTSINVAFDDLLPQIMSENPQITECERDAKRMRINDGHRIGFRTKSEVEILDDGFKWRKYGKKSVKNSPNPRNYYRCSSEGCGVKKRVERDREDPDYVITTYDGVHNHPSPGQICCSFAAHHHRHHQAEPSDWVSFGRGQLPFVAPNTWSAAVHSANSSC